MARKWWTLTAVVAGMFMLLLDVTIVNVALPQIRRAFGASLPDLQWIIDAYALTLAALLLLTAGALADRFGRAHHVTTRLAGLRVVQRRARRAGLQADLRRRRPEARPPGQQRGPRHSHL
jgi:MFS family permease